MAGEVDGVEARKQTEQGRQGEPQGQGRPQEEQPARETVSVGDLQAQLAAKDEQIEALRAKVAEAAKTAETTEALNAEIEELKRQMVDERTEFALKSAGARNVKAARALLDDHEGDVEALREAEPWLFAQTGALLN